MQSRSIRFFLSVLVLFLLHFTGPSNLHSDEESELKDHLQCKSCDNHTFHLGGDTKCERCFAECLALRSSNGLYARQGEAVKCRPSPPGPSGLVNDTDTHHVRYADVLEEAVKLCLAVQTILYAVLYLWVSGQEVQETEERLESSSVVTVAGLTTILVMVVALFLLLRKRDHFQIGKKLRAYEEDSNKYSANSSPLHQHASDLDGRSMWLCPELIGINLKEVSMEKGLSSGKDSSFLDSFNKPFIHHLFQFRRDQSFHQTPTVCPAVSLISHFSSGVFGQPGSTQELQKEGVRLTTFKDFPTTSPVSAIRLSQAGFYYTGEGDKVKCFSCGVTHQGWKVGDRPLLVHTNISPNCPLVRGNDTTNMPLPLPVTSVPTFAQPQVNGAGSMDSGYGSRGSDGQPQSGQPQSIPAASMNGHASMTDVQTDGSEHEPTVYGTNLLSLSGPPALTGPAPNFNALQQGTASADPRSQPSTTGSGALATDSAAPRQPLPSKRLDLGGAVYPLYSQMDARRRSFQNWQHVRGLPSVDELITLGFFYAGYADCVRCFFCGIGLKSWEPDDNPAEVHARWRPTCDYLRLVRGDEFVDRVSGNQAPGGNAQNANEQNNQGRAGGNEPDAAGRPSIRAQHIAPAAPRNQAPQGGPPRPPPANNSNQQNSVPPATPLPDTPAVRRARISGYRDQQIKEATDAIKNMGMEDQMDGMLFEVLANLNENQPAGRGLSNRTGNTDNQQGGGNNGSELQADGVVADEVPDAVGAAPPGGQNTESRARERQLVLQQENARLRDIRTCQRCHHNSVGVIFLPCGHIVACTDCAPNIRRCIRCDAVIRATANVYFS